MDRRLLLLVLGLCCSFNLAIGSAFAQHKHTDAATEEDLFFFYKDPRPERVLRLLNGFEKQSFGQKWEAYPPLAGFLAVVYRRPPDQIEKWVPSAPGAKMAETVAAALRLSGNQEAYRRLSLSLQNVGRDNRLAAEFAHLPSRLEDLQIRSPTHLDIVWGASFASGDPKFVQMIIDFYARTANRSEQIAIDVAQTAIAIADGPTGPKLGPKHGDALGKEIVFAAVALWALRSNGREHRFVNDAIADYIARHPYSSATKALVAITQRRV